MPSEYNKGRADQMLGTLNGLLDGEKHHLSEWIKVIAPIVSFLLARYIDGK